jgi:hypothetical protein
MHHPSRTGSTNPTVASTEPAHPAFRIYSRQDS